MASHDPSRTRTRRRPSRNQPRALTSGAVATLEEARRRVPAVDAAWMAWQRDRGLASSLLAGAIAYRLFVWLLPFALLLTAALGFLRAADADLPEESADELGLSRYIATTVGAAAQQAEQGRWFILAIGLFALFTSGIAGAKALRAIHFLCWEQAPTKLRRPPVAVLALSGIFLAGGAVTGLAHQARQRSGSVGLAVTLAVFLAYALLWLLTSSVLPHGGTPWTALVPGALLFAAGAQGLHLFTVYYLVEKIDSSSDLYGGLGAAAAILLWLYLFGRLIVGAAVLDVVLWRRRSLGSPGHLEGSSRAGGEEADRALQGERHVAEQHSVTAERDARPSDHGLHRSEMVPTSGAIEDVPVGSPTSAPATSAPEQ